VSTKIEGAIRKRLAGGDGMLKVAKTLGDAPAPKKRSGRSAALTLARATA